MTATTAAEHAPWYTSPWVRRTTFGAYLVVLGWFVATRGLPIDRPGQAMWLVAGIFAAMVGRPLVDLARVLRDWALVFAALLAYDHTRGVADTLAMPVHVEDIISAERALFGGTLPTIWLQDRLYVAAEPQWYDVVVALVYTTHFFAVWVLGAVIYVKAKQHWGNYARRALGLAYAGLATYILFPAAPPWWAAREELIPEVARISTRGWSEIGLTKAANALDFGQAGSNKVAAMPSLHAAFSLLVVVLLWTWVKRPLWRAMLLLYPAAMAFSLVYSGEHYLIDAVIGWVFVAAVCLAARAWEAWMARRRAAPPAEIRDQMPAAEMLDDEADQVSERS